MYIKRINITGNFDLNKINKSEDEIDYLWDKLKNTINIIADEEIKKIISSDYHIEYDFHYEDHTEHFTIDEKDEISMLIQYLYKKHDLISELRCYKGNYNITREIEEFIKHIKSI